MNVYHVTAIEPNHTIHVNLKTDMLLNCGAKRIAVASNSDDVCFAWSEFVIPNSTKCGIQHFEFPVVNGKSPCNFQITNYGTEEAVVNILIEELGGEPFEDYFTGEL